LDGSIPKTRDWLFRSAIVKANDPVPEHAVRLQFPLPDKMKMDWPDFPVISPDGRRVVLPGIAYGGSRHLWLRSLDSLTDQLLPGTEEAYAPFWSPDSRSFAFFTDASLRRINAAGGPAQTICNVSGSNPGGTWSRNGVILFSGTFGSGMFRVSAAGGEPESVIQLDKSRQETGQSFPQFLPDGRHFLYLSEGSGRHDLYVGSLDAKGTRMLIQGGRRQPTFRPGF
jgi:Tol biopolymer transport system component